MRLTLIVLILIFGLNFLIAQESEERFGVVTIQMDAKEEQSFRITNALLYENASVGFDTTVQVQDNAGTVTYYYPQILEGQDNILRLILEPQDNAGGDFYDVAYNLGDSLEEGIVYENDSAKAFLNQNGQLMHFRQATKNMNGKFQILKNKNEKEIISGELSVTFELPRNEEASDLSQISMTGHFEVPTGEFREVSLSSAAPTKEKKGKYKQNLYVAIIITAMAVIALGLQ